ncbi:MAG: IclR family transcriptional regulator [Dehalococcoidia bacterium]|nr:IclR family transcriptional regulator [Dehalococcoidia bacterium]
MTQPKRIHVVSKVATILRLFPGVESLSLAEIARGLSANRSSVYHVVQTLVDEGLLQQDPGTRRYRLGETLLWLVPPHARSTALLAAAEDAMYQCSQATGFDVWLALLELDRVYYIARVDGVHPLKVHMPLLQLQPAHAVASGRALLAGLSDERARATLQFHTVRKMTHETVVDIDTIVARIAQARSCGWAETEGEHIEGAADIAVPVRGLNQSVVAAISIGAPSHVFGPDRRREVLPMLLAAADLTRRRLLHGAIDGGEGECSPPQGAE